MKTLNGQPIDPKRLEAHAEAMFDALERIANGQTGRPESADQQALREVARAALAPCHFFDFSVPTGGLACTHPEEMGEEAFAAWLAAIPEDKRQGWETRRWVWKAAREWIDDMRNVNKREYAQGYLEYLFQRRPEAPRVSTISYMAAQCVRLRLDEMINRGMERAARPQEKPADPEQPLLMPSTPTHNP